jgi:hypothetical protein
MLIVRGHRQAAPGAGAGTTPGNGITKHQEGRAVLFQSGDQIEITYVEGGRQDQLCCTMVDEENGLLKVVWGPDVIVFNTHADSFIRARLIRQAQQAMTPDEAMAWHTDRLRAVHEAFIALQEPEGTTAEQPQPISKPAT